MAVHLHNRGHFGDAISRAYYALVAAIQGLLLTVDSRPTTHAGLKNQLGLHFVKADKLPRDVSDVFEELRQRRNEADYEMRSFSQEQTRQLLDAAERVVDHVDTLVP